MGGRPFLPDRADTAAWGRLVLHALGAALVLGVVVLGWQAARAALLLDRASDQAAVLVGQVARGEAGAARATAADLADAAGRADGSTDGPLWAAAGLLPLVGDDVEAVRTITRELDRVASGALPTIVDVTTQISLDAFSPQDGRVDIANLASVAPRLSAPRAVLERSADEVGAIEPTQVVGRLQGPVRRLQGVLTDAAVVARVADDAAQLLPGMLGQDGKRRYLLLIQNNAEVRSLGGIPGSFAVIEAEQGRVRMEEQGSNRDVPIASEPVVPLPADERGALPEAIAKDLRDTTTDPGFDRAARYASALVSRAVDSSFDGVVSVDPITLGYLLDGIGAVDLRDGTRLTGANAVDELLNDVYRRYPTDPEGQDDVFEDAARRIFDAFVAGDGRTQPILEGLVRAGIDNRILVWSRDPDEQARLSRTGVGGLLSASRTVPHVGAYLSDAASTKLQYYLDATHSLRSERCLDGSRQSLVLQTRLASRVPSDVDSLPLSITGDPAGSVRRGDQRLNLRVVAPAGGTIESIDIDGTSRQPVGGAIGERPVTVIPVTVAPGDTVTVTVRLASGPRQRADAVLTTTPGIAPTENDVRVPSRCD